MQSCCQSRKLIAWKLENTPNAAPETISSSIGPSGCADIFGGSGRVDERLQLEKKDPLLGVEGDIVPVDEEEVLTDRSEGVDTFREGRGVVAGVTYASSPPGNMVLYNLHRVINCERIVFVVLLTL